MTESRARLELERGGHAQRPGGLWGLHPSASRGLCLRGQTLSLPPVNKAACESFMRLCLKIDEERPTGQLPGPRQQQCQPRAPRSSGAMLLGPSQAASVRGPAVG